MKIETSPDFARVQSRYNWRRWIARNIAFRGLGLGLLVKADTRGQDNIPKSGPTMIMINHIAAIDPILVMAEVTTRYVVPMSKIENFGHWFFGAMMNFYGVYAIHRGEVDRVALQTTVDLIKSGILVLMAPEGHREPELHEAKDGVTYVAVKSDAVIVPTGVDGTREFLDNLKHLRRTPVSLRFGKPFRFRTKGRERISRPEMARMTQEAMYQLAALLPDNRRGFYSDLSKATTDTLEFV